MWCSFTGIGKSNSILIHTNDVRGALGRSRTYNLLIRSQMLYPLSYERLRAMSLVGMGVVLTCHSQGPQPLLR